MMVGFFTFLCFFLNGEEKQSMAGVDSRAGAYREEYSMEDLRQTGAEEYRQIGTGIFRQTRNGKRVETTRGMSYIPTRSGKIEKDKWLSLIEKAAEREGKLELLARIDDSCRRLAWLKTDKDRHEYALGILCSGAYLYWPEWKETEKEMKPGE